MADRDVVILAAVRTAQARFQGGFAGTSAVDLAAVVMEEALARAGVTGAQLDEVFFGNVVQAGQGQNPARQASLKAGIPSDVPAMTLNRVCASGTAAVAAAANAIRAGEGDLYLVGGTENMTRAPWLLQDGRRGYRMGMPSDTIYDAMVWDGLWCAIGNYHMGLTAETLCARFNISREAQDEAAFQSHVKAVAAIDAGRFADEIVAVAVPQRKGDPVIIDRDECPRRDASSEAMAKLRPAFSPEGSVTAGNSSAISDGASALVVASAAKAAELGRDPLAQLLSHAVVAVPAEIMGYGETRAAEAALQRAGLSPADVSLAELNEAFACVSVLATRDLGLAAAVVNVTGGAVALGHPIGSTGARMLVTLVHELRRRGGGIGLTSACVGGGQGAAAVIKVQG